MAVPGGLSATGEAVYAALASVRPGPLLVALSGGADSAVAAWGCSAARPPGSVRAVYVDHGWEASADLRRAAAAIAAHLDLPLSILPISPGRGASREGMAREARLAALVGAAEGDQIVMGHQADDAAETVVGNLLRGAGTTGLAGIAAERGPFVRPLLGLRRADLRHLAGELGLPFLDDPSNRDLAIRRNVIRHEIMPQLSAHVDGDLVELLLRSAGHLAAVDAYLDDVAPRLTIRVDEGALVCAAAPLATADPVLAARAVREILRKAHPPYPGTSREVDAIMATASGRTRRADLSEGLVVEREGPDVALYRPAAAVLPQPIEFTAPGSVEFGRNSVVARIADHGQKAHLSHDICRVAVEGRDFTVRAATPGDRIDFGAGSKSVADALSEAGVPVRKRSAWPLVESHGTIIWVAGVRTAASVRTETATSTWIELERRKA